MKKVIPAFKTMDDRRKRVLKLEIDYELYTLYDAMVINDQEQIKHSKKRLESYRQELLQLQD
jgi:hypothetical protein